MRTFVGFLGAAALAAFWRPAFAQTVAGPSPAPSAPASEPQPTTPAARAALSALQQVCLPLLEGQDLKTVSKAVHLKNDDGQWILPISGKQHVSVSPPDAANPHVCSASISYRPGSGSAILAAIGRWAQAQAPPLQPDKVDVTSTQGSSQVVTSSWTAATPHGAEGLVLDEQTPSPGGRPAGGLDQATLLVSLTPS